MLLDLLLQHADHWHPFLDPVEGNDFELYPAPEPEDFFASTNSYLEIILYAIDENGLTGEVNRLVQPMMVPVGVDSSPPGMTVIVESEPVTAFDQVWSWKNHEITMEAQDEPPLLFQQWSDGEINRERTVLLNMTSPLFIAFFCVDDGGSCENEGFVCCEGPCNKLGYCGEEIETPVPEVSTGSPSQVQEVDGGNVPTAAPTDLVIPAPAQSPALPDSVSATSTIPEDDKTLSAGGKTGISLLVIGVVAACGIFFVLRRRKHQQRSGDNKQVGGDIESSEIVESPTDETSPKSVSKKPVGSEIETLEPEEKRPSVGVEAPLL